ncbi:MAG: tetratricopeptide repeat protein [Pseudomonadota bacterium]
MAALSNEEWERAEALLIRLCRVAPKSLQAHFNLGLLLRQRGDLDQARKVFEQTLVIEPGHKRTLMELGLIWAHSRQYDKSLDIFSKLAAIDPSDKAVRYYVGTLLIERGEPERALKHLKHAPKNEASAYYRAKALIQLGRLHEALNDLRALPRTVAMRVMTGQRRGTIFIDQRLYKDILVG